MRSFIVFGLVAVATVVFASTSATAVVLGGGGGNSGGGYGGGGGGGGGKNTTKYTIYVKNKDHYKTMACWIHEQHSAYPYTLGQLRSEMTYVDPYATGHSDKLKKGYYEVCLFCAHDLYGPSYHHIDHYYYEDYTVDKEVCHLEYGDKHLCCDQYGLWYEGGYGGGGYGGGGGGY